MLMKVDYYQARDLLLEKTTAVSTERIPLSKCSRRILARNLEAGENIPPFDRSAYDGYALLAADTREADDSHPVSLRIIEEVPAGAVAMRSVVSGTAVKILTGAPLPSGADAVIPFEKTIFTEETVTVSSPLKEGLNIIRKGDDVTAGDFLAWKGTPIDPALMGTMASQGIADVTVYRVPRIGIFSIGNEVIEAEECLEGGKIRDSNRHMLSAAIEKSGLEVVVLGICGDCVEEISALMRRALVSCDAVVCTGGVSVGEYDLTPEAMKNIGADIMIRGVSLKPGMASAFGEKDGRIIYGLSGNPASAFTLFYAVVLPSLKKLAGYRDCIPPEIAVSLASDFRKQSPCTRLLRGRLDLSTGSARIEIPPEQGNAALCSSIGCDVMALIPPGSGSIASGTVLKGFLI